MASPVKSEETKAPLNSGFGERDLTEDPRYKQGKALLKEQKYDESLELLGLLVAEVAEESEYRLDAGAVYFLYGDALLEKVEETSDVFGAAMKQADENEGQEEGEEGDAAEAEGGDDKAGPSSAGAAEDEDDQKEGNDDVTKVQVSEEAQDDLEVAWENLEVARVIFETYKDQVPKSTLGSVYRRLGDLQKLNANWGQAVEDYGQAYKLYAQEVEADSRVLAELHYGMATAHIYNTSDDQKAMLESKKAALEHYIKCAELLKARIDKLTAGSGKGPASKSDDVADLEAVYDEVKETIEATRDEIKNELITAPQSVTTIGFGAPSSAAASSSGVAVGLTPVANVLNGTSKAGAAGSSGVTVMAVKKKIKPTPAEPPANGTAAAGNGNCKENISTKLATESDPLTKKRPSAEAEPVSEGPAEGPVSKAVRIED